MATMSIEEMKWLLYKVYPLGDWQANVEAMSDAQTHETYMRLLAAGKIKVFK